MTEQADAHKCPNCGALVARAAARFCDYCGAKLPKQDAAQPQPRFGDLAERFARLEEDPSYPELMEATPSAGQGTFLSQIGVGAVGLVLFIVVGLFMTGVAGAVFAPMALIPLAIVVVGVVAMLKGVMSGATRINAPLRRMPALVVGERTKITGGGDNSSAKTSYYITLEFKSGDRAEFSTSDEVIGAVTEGDLGVAYTKADYLVDFRRVRV